MMPKKPACNDYLSTSGSRGSPRGAHAQSGEPASPGCETARGVAPYAWGGVLGAPVPNSTPFAAGTPEKKVAAGEQEAPQSPMSLTPP